MGVDYCTGTYPTARACILFDQHSKFARCDLDSNVLRAADPGLRFQLTSQVLSPNPNITGDEKRKAVARTFKKKLAMVLTSRSAAAWEVSSRLDATRVKPGHISHTCCLLYEDYEPHKKFRHISLGQ